MPQLECRNLSLGYDSKAIVSDLNFSINKGDYLCIVGENGSGKTTLMKTLLNLHSPLSGSIITGDGLKTNEIGYLPQQTVVQRDFPASVKEIVLSGCQGHCGIRPFYKKEEKKNSPSKYGANGNKQSFLTLLQGTFRRSAAESTSCKSIVCYKKTAFAGRACFRT